MAFETFNYGNVLAQGEAIKGARMQNALLKRQQQEQEDPSSVYNQSQQQNLERARQQNALGQNTLDEQKKLQNTKETFLSMSKIASDPSTRDEEFKRLKALGIMKPDFVPPTDDPVKIKENAQKAVEHIKLQLQTYQGNQSQGGGTAGAIQIANAYKAANPSSTDAEALDYGVKAWTLQNVGGEIKAVNAFNLGRGGEQGLPNRPAVGGGVKIGLSPDKEIPYAATKERVTETEKAGVATAVKREEEKRTNAIVYDTYQSAMDEVKASLGKTTTGPIAGRLPAYTAGQQTAEGAVSAMAPILKQLFRSAGEGTFTDKDQELLLKMVPTRTDRPEAREAKINNINQIVKSKLGLKGSAPRANMSLDDLVNKYAK